MKIRKALILPLIVSMLLGVFMIGPVGAQSTTIGVEPVDTIDPVLYAPGSTFTVEIWIRNVADLAGFDFQLAYDTTVLTATLIEDGGIFGPSGDYFPLINVTDDAAGYLHYASMEAFGQPSFNGDGRAAIIHFEVDDVGESALNLYDTKLGDSASPPNPIAHTAIDGYFRNIPPPLPPSVTLAKRKAWPEHHSWGLLTDENAINDLFAVVENDGPIGVWVKVVFTIANPQGIPVAEVETDRMWLAAGAIFGDKKYARYKYALIIGGYGADLPATLAKYYVSAVAWADTDADGIPDTPMGRVKTFSFDVVLTTED